MKLHILFERRRETIRKEQEEIRGMLSKIRGKPGQQNNEQRLKARLKTLRQERSQEDMDASRDETASAAKQIDDKRQTQIDQQKQKTAAEDELDDRLAPQGNEVGYWLTAEEGKRRAWKPVFGSSAGVNDAVFPFDVPSNIKNSIGGFKYQAFNLIEAGRGTKELIGEERKLFKGLLQALKQLERSKNFIPPNDMHSFIQAGTNVLMRKTGLHKVPPSDIILAIPPSTSPTAKEIGMNIKQHLSIPDANVFSDHFKKRSGREVIADIKASTEIQPNVKKRVLEQLQAAHRRVGLDAEIQIKKLTYRGDKNILTKANIPFIEMAKEIDLPNGEIPYLVVADDRVSSGHTAKTIRRLFEDWTDIKIPDDRSYILSLIDTTKR